MVLKIGMVKESEKRLVPDFFGSWQVFCQFSYDLMNWFLVQLVEPAGLVFKIASTTKFTTKFCPKFNYVKPKKNLGGHKIFLS